MSLAEKTCIACHEAVEPMTVEEAHAMAKNLKDWEVDTEGKYIHAKWSFKNYVQAQEFVVKVGAIAEEQGHHPDISFGWGYAEITLMTHNINGLHENDFIVAAKINELEA